MQFRHLPVSSLEDCTHNFEQLQSELGQATPAGRPLLLSSPGALRKVNFGTFNQIYAEVTTVTSENIAHSMAVTPQVILACVSHTGAVIANDLTLEVFNIAATTFAISTRRASGVNLNATVGLAWVAIG